MRVTVEPYDPSWQRHFLKAKIELEQALSQVEYKGIEHVGSTSVPGLAAKPVIDIDIVVRQQDFEKAIEALKAAGYEYRGDMGIPDRYCFKRANPNPAQNIYVCLDGCLALRNHLLVRDVCQRDDTIRDAYGQRKIELSKQEWSSVDDYCMAKNDILAWILSHGGMLVTETAQIRALNTVSQDE